MTGIHLKVFLDFLEPFLLYILVLFSCIMCNIIVLMGVNYFRTFNLKYINFCIIDIFV